MLHAPAAPAAEVQPVLGLSSVSPDAVAPPDDSTAARDADPLLLLLRARCLGFLQQRVALLGQAAQFGGQILGTCLQVGDLCLALRQRGFDTTFVLRIVCVMH